MINSTGSTAPWLQQSYKQAEVTTNVNLSANTGNNLVSSQGSAKVKTGDAQVNFNLFNFINDSFFQSRWFISTINVLKDWSGNLIFAYPDLSLDLAASSPTNNPDHLNLTLNLENLGQDTAHDSQLSLALPSQLNVVSSSTGSKSDLSWNWSKLASQQKQTVTVTVRLTEPEKIKEKTELVISAQADTTDPESNYANNQTKLTVVIDPEDLSQDGGNVGIGGVELPDELIQQETVSSSNLELPELQLTASNNTGSLVYPGDTIIFELIIKNSGGGPAEDMYINHNLFTPDGSPAGSLQFYIGPLSSQQEVAVSFEFKLDDQIVLPIGQYHTITQAFCFSESGQLVISNEAETGFNLGKIVSSNNWLNTAQANSLPPVEVEAAEPQVLGAAASRNNDHELLLKLLLLVSLSSELVVRWLKTKYQLPDTG